ncbi:dihydrodipicolinate synthase family protein [Falsiroseomonas bella]|uniref:Dihydrodipicolinate synthase family protein n=1 Tax=Falsiroseomonas bella TaxID=2184016 RepID=A0A317F808_9PROT|nr:dihydrodipicolinate synthase family protein [Falsiroseomonas bella]PWS34885.1 dihydrodipicolinate synthase family protein [Falsiroseomonas bella]
MPDQTAPRSLSPRLAEALSGVSGILVTPFDAEDRPAPDRLAPIVARAAAAGIGALTVNGNTSEFYGLTFEEARRMQTAVPQIVGGRSVVVAGVGRSVAEAAQLARAAKADGCDAIMIHQPPDPFRAPRGVAAYVARVAEAAQGLPVLLYLRDDGAGTEAIAALCDIPGVVGVKWATPNLMNLAAARRARPDIAWICGLAEPWAPPMTALGARGFTSGVINVAPHLSMRVLRALQRGDMEDANAAIAAIAPFEALRAAEGNGANVSVVKAALALAGEAVGPARPPAAWPLPAAALDALKAVMAAWPQE